MIFSLNKLLTVSEVFSATDSLGMIALVCFGGAFLLVSICLSCKIWSREGSRSKKAFWTFVVLIPLLGWLLYGALYKIPRSHAPEDRCPVNAAAFYGGPGAPGGR